MQNNNIATKTQNKVLFDLGQAVMTIGAKEALAESNQSPLEYLARHQSGDWGIVSKDDAQENDFSIRNDFRIFSAYKTSQEVKIWVITEADRRVTTILLPDEY